MATATKSRTVKSAPDVDYTDVTNDVIAALEAGTVIWHAEWTSLSSGLPSNLDSGRPYRGINIFLLQMTQMIKGYSSNRWATYKQMAERGGQVRKGEKSTRIVFWKILRKEEMVDGQAKTKHIPLLRHYNVFNEDQADWDPETDRRRVGVERTPVEAIAAAEEIIAEYLATGPSLGHGGNRAYYSQVADHIQMPERDDFHTPEAYYSTLYHEATHSSGHARRLARAGIAEGTFGRFGDPVYSYEELVAEMGAAMLCAVAGIAQAATVESSAAYVAHWLKALKADNRLVVQAANAAQKAVDLILGTTFDNEKEEVQV